MKLLIVFVLTLAAWARAESGENLQACLIQGLKQGIQKTTQLNGTKPAAILYCDGELAKKLYAEVEPYGRLKTGETVRGESRIHRLFGRGSRCTRILETPDRRPTEAYECVVELDMMPDLVGTLPSEIKAQ